jgi:hypothetical protein
MAAALLSIGNVRSAVLVSPIAFTQPARISQPSLSPDGKHVAARFYIPQSNSVSDEGIVVFDVSETAITPMLRTAKYSSVSSVQWRSDRELIVNSSVAVSVWDIVSKTDSGPLSVGGYVLDAHWGADDELLISKCVAAWKPGARQVRQIATRFAGYADALLVDANAKPHVIARDTAGAPQDYTFSEANKQWQGRNISGDASDYFWLMFARAAASKGDSGSKAALERYETLQRQAASHVYPILSRSRGALLAATTAESGFTEAVALHASVEAPLATMRARFPQAAVMLVGASDDFSKMLFKLEQIALPESYVIFSPATNSMLPLPEPRPDVIAAGTPSVRSDTRLLGASKPLLIIEPSAGVAVRGTLVTAGGNAPRASDPVLPKEFDEPLMALVHQGLRIVRVNMPLEPVNYDESSVAWRTRSASYLREAVDAARSLSSQRNVCLYGEDLRGYLALAAAAEFADAIDCVAVTLVPTDLTLVEKFTRREGGARVFDADYVKLWRWIYGSDSQPVTANLPLSWATLIKARTQLSFYAGFDETISARRFYSALRANGAQATWNDAFTAYSPVSWQKQSANSLLAVAKFVAPN